jgi:protein tyrosine/serine phosphatase
MPGTLSEAEGAALRYDLDLLAEDGSRDAHSLRGLLGPQASLLNLRIGTPYRWRVRARLGRRVIAGSGWGRFTTHPAAPRWIHAPGITNVRDLGGWPLPDGRRVRQGLLFRGSEMNSHCSITEAGRAVLLRELAIRTDLDLRGAGEERQAVLDPARVDYVNIPLASYDMIASPEYIKHYRDVFHLLSSRARYPVFMHCWGGADRAGTVAFLVGALLGMRLEDLILDYELTSLSIWGERSRHSEVFQELLQTLEVFARKGSSLQTQVERYLHVIDISQQEIAAIRDILTERESIR